MRDRDLTERVVVTGVGAITPIGHGVGGLREGIEAGRSGVRAISRFDASPFTSRVAAQVDDFDPAAHLDFKTAKRIPRFVQFAIVSARQALADAALDLDRVDRERVGAFIGTALGGAEFGEEQHNVFLSQGIRRVRPTLAGSVFGGAASSNIAIDIGVNGPTSANSDACASGTIAIAQAVRLLRSGEVDVMLAGGAEAPLAPMIFGAFDVIRAMSSRNDDAAAACRPFDRDRDGFVMAEGAAVLVLERLRDAEARGAPIYGEILGSAITNDAYHMITPLPSGAQAVRAIRLALGDAGVSADRIDHVNAHASSTALNDVTETRVLKAVFGDRAQTIPISGTKSMHGHALGASGAIETAIALLALRHDYVPPTINLDVPDPECDLDYVARHGRRQRVHCVLKNSFAFGGVNAVLVLGRYPATRPG